METSVTKSDSISSDFIVSIVEANGKYNQKQFSLCINTCGINCLNACMSNVAFMFKWFSSMRIVEVVAENKVTHPIDMETNMTIKELASDIHDLSNRKRPIIDGYIIDMIVAHVKRKSLTFIDFRNSKLGII